MKQITFTNAFKPLLSIRRSFLFLQHVPKAFALIEYVNSPIKLAFQKLYAADATYSIYSAPVKCD